MKLVVSHSEIKGFLADKYNLSATEIEITSENAPTTPAVVDTVSFARVFFRNISAEVIDKNKIQFIGGVRAATGCGLKEAKELVEEFTGPPTDG